MNWNLLIAAVPAAFAVYKAFDIARRLIHNRREFAQHFPLKMQQAVTLWLVVAFASFLGAPALMAVGIMVGPVQLFVFGIALSLYAVIWTAVGYFILRTQREYLRWLHRRFEVIHYLETPADQRPGRVPAAA